MYPQHHVQTINTAPNIMTHEPFIRDLFSLPSLPATPK